MKQKINNNIT